MNLSLNMKESVFLLRNQFMVAITAVHVFMSCSPSISVSLTSNPLQLIQIFGCESWRGESYKMLMTSCDSLIIHRRYWVIWESYIRWKVLGIHNFILAMMLYRFRTLGVRSMVCLPIPTSRNALATWNWCVKQHSGQQTPPLTQINTPKKIPPICAALKSTLTSICSSVASTDVLLGRFDVYYAFNAHSQYSVEQEKGPLLLPNIFWLTQETP